MLIAVDGFEASAEGRVGVGRFEVELLKGLYNIVETGHAPSLQKFRIYVPGNIGSNLPKETSHWHYRRCRFNRLWSQAALPFYLAVDRPKPDVFFAPVHYTPRFCPFPAVLGIMDLSFLFFPKMFKKTDLYKLKNWTAYSIARAKKIIAISNSTKNDIIKHYQVDETKVEVVYPGSFNLKTQMSKLKAIAQISKVKEKYEIDGNYILYVGTLQPRKNLVRLIEAFNKLTVETRHAASVQSLNAASVQSLKLVIAGKKGWLYEEIFTKVKELELEKDVVFTGYVEDRDLPALYKGAKCFCLVSLYEGFGFPVLEAMSMGVPVVCSNVSSLPEIAGDAAILVDPKSVESIKEGIEKVLKMNEEEITKLRNKEIRQASNFTWEKAARETLKVLEEIGKSNANDAN